MKTRIAVFEYNDGTKSFLCQRNNFSWSRISLAWTGALLWGGYVFNEGGIAVGEGAVFLILGLAATIKYYTSIAWESMRHKALTNPNTTTGCYARFDSLESAKKFLDKLIKETIREKEKSFKRKNKSITYEMYP